VPDLHKDGSRGMEREGHPGFEDHVWPGLRNRHLFEIRIVFVAKTRIQACRIVGGESATTADLLISLYPASQRYQAQRLPSRQ
jgi:hypothetical protein